MKVLHIDTGTDWRGGQAQVFNLVKFLPDQVTSHLLTPPRSELSSKSINLLKDHHQHTHPMRGEWDISAGWKIHTLHKQKNYDLIHAHSSRALGICWVTSILGNLPPFLETRRLEKPVAENWLSRQKYMTAKHHIAISNPVKNSLVESGLDSNNISVIPSGVDSGKFKRAEPNYQPLKAQGIEANATIIGNIGALTYQKNQEAFIKAANQVHQQFPEFQFVIAGEGKRRNQLHDLITQKKLENNVHLLGFVDDISGLIKTFDLFVLTSVFEGLCSTLLQVMAARVPILASPVGGVTDLIKDRETGFHAEPENPEEIAQKIIALVEEDIDETILERAQNKAQEFDYRSTSDRVNDVYEDLITDENN